MRKHSDSRREDHDIPGFLQKSYRSSKFADFFHFQADSINPDDIKKVFIALIAVCVVTSLCGIATSHQNEPALSAVQSVESGSLDTNPLTAYGFSDGLSDGSLYTFPFCIRGDIETFSFPLDRAEADYLSGNTPRYTGNVAEYYRTYINNEHQDELLSPFVNIIQNSKFSGLDDDARVAISLVQHLDYVPGSSHVKFPYRSLIEGGDCDDKATLLAYILKELEYGVAIFYFKEEKHMTVGIRCDAEYAYRNSGYCFVEPSRPSIATDSNGAYKNIGTLTSNPEIITISDGKPFATIGEEFSDAQAWNHIRQKSGTEIESSLYNEWIAIKLKYNLD